MRALAACGLVAACVYVGITCPVLAIVALGAFLTIGAVCEVARR